VNQIAPICETNVMRITWFLGLLLVQLNSLY